MKILIINYRFFISGGPERYMFDLIEILEKNGHDVIPFSVKSSKNKPTPFEKYFAEPIGGQDEAYFDQLKKTPKMIVDLIGRLFYSYSVRNKLEQLIRETKPDVAYILHHYNKLSPSVIDACKKFNLPVVMRLSDYFLVCPQAHMLNGRNELCDECITKGYLSAVKNRCIKNSFVGSVLKSLALISHRHILRMYDKVDVFICTNPFMQHKMVASGFDHNKLRILPTFKQKHNVLRLSNAEYGIINTQKYILFFGRFSPEKGIETLIKAYLKSSLIHLNIHLYLIGGTRNDLSLELDPDNEYIVAEYCHFYEFMDRIELEKYISNTLYVVHPSKCYENMPNSILEAFSFGKTVLTCNIGSLPYLVNQDVGLLYEYENTDDLSCKLAQLLDDDKRQNLEQNIPTYFNRFNEIAHYGQLITILGEKFEQSNNHAD